MRLIKYLRDTKGEMKHVSWPTRKQALIYTGLVVVVSIIIAIYLGIFDFVFARIIESLI